MLGRLAAAALRSGGRLVVAQVVPESITPWDIRRKTSSTYSSISKSVRKKPKKKAAKPSSGFGKSSGSKKSGSKKNGSKPPKASQNTRPRFDKNSWSQGRGLNSADKWTDDDKPRTSPKSSRQPSRRLQQLRDFTRHPVLVMQMGADELRHSTRQFGRRVRDNARSDVRRIFRF